MPIFKYFFKLTLILFCVLGECEVIFAQKPKQDTTQTPKEKIQLSGIRFGLDVVPLGVTFLDKNRTQWEANAELLLGNSYLLCLDVGSASLQRFEGDYSNKGTYWRIGADYNLWRKKGNLQDGQFTFGFRYCLANFQHQLDYVIQNPYWGNLQGAVLEQNLRISWIEFTATLKARIAPNFWMGPVARFDLKFNNAQDSILEINDIPGFGVTNNIRINLGYQLRYQIQWKKTPIKK